MITFHKETKMADVIYSNHLLLPVINRFGIYMGFQDKTIDQVCGESGTDILFFLEILNTYNNEKYFPQEKLSAFSLSSIVNYLRKTHVYYISFLVPQMEERLERMKTPEFADNLAVLRSFYSKYKQEIKTHIREEEEKVFPYVLDLEQMQQGKMPIDEFKHKHENYSIYISNDEHSEIDDKLLDLKNLIIKYLPANYDLNASIAFVNSLFHFDQDLQNHARIEEKILYPKVRQLEITLL